MTVEIKKEKIPKYGYKWGLKTSHYKWEHSIQKCPYFIEDCMRENWPRYKLENKAVNEMPNSPLSLTNITHKSRMEPLKSEMKTVRS
jgi:hypothetical protein